MSGAVALLLASRAAVAGAAVRSRAGLDVVAARVERVVLVVVITMDRGVGIVAVGCHGERGLVGIDVLRGAAATNTVVTRELAVELVVLEAVDAEKCRPGEEETDKEAQANDGLALAAGGAAQVSRVVRRLRGKCREPDDGVDGVDSDHDMGLGQVSCSWGPGRPYEVDPCWYREEKLRWRDKSFVSLFCCAHSNDC